MDSIASLAASVIAVLAPYLVNAGQEFAKEGGKAAVGKIDSLYQSIKKRFQRKPTAKESLADLEADPKNQDAQASFRLQLTKQMKEDPRFAEDLQKLVAEIRHDPASISFLTQVYGKVENLVNADSIGTLTFNKNTGKK